MKTAFLILTIIVTVSVAAVPHRAQDKGALPQNVEGKYQGFLNKLPVVDFDSPQPSDPDERAKRHAISKFYNDPASNKTRNAILTAEISAIRNEWDWGLESALPAAQSTAIVVGEVIAAKAYLSEDKYQVYSEFTVRVDEVLKNDRDKPIAVDDSIFIDRLGGRVRHRSGRVGSFYVSGQGVPEVGKRYVFFLGFNRREARGVTDPRAMNRHLLTGYELRSGAVYPLDSSGARNFQEYRGKDVTRFLDEVRNAISNSSPVKLE